MRIQISQHAYDALSPAKPHFIMIKRGEIEVKVCTSLHGLRVESYIIFY